MGPDPTLSHLVLKLQCRTSCRPADLWLNLRPLDGFESSPLRFFPCTALPYILSSCGTSDGFETDIDLLLSTAEVFDCTALPYLLPSCEGGFGTDIDLLLSTASVFACTALPYRLPSFRP